MDNNFDYSKKDIIDALKKVGVKKGNSLFSHSNIGFFGKLKDAKYQLDYYLAFKEAIFEVIGMEGTFVVPTFSYSFCRGEIFDLYKTPSSCGLLSEMVRLDSKSLRSEDANFSVAGIGKNAEYFTKNISKYSFGPDSFWDRFYRNGGVFCNFNFDAGATFIHYVERKLQVPYRFDKSFSGKYLLIDKFENRTFYYFCRDLSDIGNEPDFPSFDKRAREKGLVKISNLGRGQIVSMTAKDAFNLIVDEIRLDPCFLIKRAML